MTKKWKYPALILKNCKILYFPFADLYCKITWYLDEERERHSVLALSCCECEYKNTPNEWVRTYQVNNHPFLTCFPSFALAKGQLDAIDFVAIAIPSLRSLRRAHIRDSPLIMPLVAWRFLSVCQLLAYFCLVLGTRFLGVGGDAIRNRYFVAHSSRVRSFATSECEYRNACP